jgi:iron complex transport system substrate-binding protein
MKICSFLPAATSMIYQMGLQDYLVGVTFECPSDKPKVVRSYLEDNHFSSEEIDRIVSESKKTGKSLYYIDEQLLETLAPDIIFTQDVCDVCQIDTSYSQRAIFRLKKQPIVIPLIPRNLEDVFENAFTIAKAVGEEQKAEKLFLELNEKMQGVLNTLWKSNAPLRKVLILEWLNPIYNCGHWIPYQIAKAGGVDMLSNPSGYSIVTPFEKICLYNPEVIVVAPCGFDIKRSSLEIEKLTSLPGWSELSAVKAGKVFLADADLFTQPSTTLVDGIELLAALFHPQLFEVPPHLHHKVKSFYAVELNTAVSI